LKTGKDRGGELKLAYEMGKACRNQAVWIGLQRHAIISIFSISLLLTLVAMRSTPDAELDDLKKKYMVESPALVQEGKKSGIFTDEPLNYEMIGNSVHRICAPPLDNEKMYSLIFWTKKDGEDNTPTTDKIVSYIFFQLFSWFSINFSLVG